MDVIAATTSPSVTSHSYASEYVRITTLLPSGDFAAPVTKVWPGAWKGFDVPVFSGANSPTFSSTGRFDRVLATSALVGL